MLKAEHINVSYGAHRALHDISIAVDKGEICVILGANGAGKTTLLKTLAGLVPSAPGALVSIDGHEITREKSHTIVEAGIALVPEGRGIFGDLSVEDNLALGAYGKQARAGQAARLKQVLALFPKLAERARQTARTMSGGEQQMVAIGRALMSNPTILMLDEPSLGLSPLLCSDLFKSLRAIRETGVGILLVEQNARQSLAIADRAYLLENGHITGEGRAEDMLNDPAVQAAYLGGGDTQKHKRLGEGNIPVVSPHAARPVKYLQPETAADLAQRASAIQRAHIHALRTNRSLAANASEPTNRTDKEPSKMSNKSNSQFIDAAQLARRASDISAAFVIEQRLRAQADKPSKKKKPKSSDKSKIEKLSKKLTRLIKKQKSKKTKK